MEYLEDGFYKQRPKVEVVGKRIVKHFLKKEEYKISVRLPKNLRNKEGYNSTEIDVPFHSYTQYEVGDLSRLTLYSIDGYEWTFTKGEAVFP